MLYKRASRLASAAFGLANLISAVGCGRTSAVQSKPLGTVSSSGFAAETILTKEILNSALERVQSSDLMDFQGVVTAKVGDCNPMWLHLKSGKEGSESLVSKPTNNLSKGIVLVFDQKKSLDKFSKFSLERQSAFGYIHFSWKQNRFR